MPQGESTPPENVASSLQEHMPEAKNAREASASPIKASTKVSPSATIEKKPVYNIRETVSLDNVYEPAEVSEMKSEIPNKKKVEPIGAFSMPQGTLSKLFYGDTILLPDIAGHDYEPTIEKRTVGKTGAVILEASVSGNNSMVRSVLMEDTHTSFIPLSTSEGTYEFESVDGKGYVYSSADIKNELIDYSKTDGVVPPTSPQHEH